MKRKSLIIPLVAALVLCMVAGALAAEEVATKANVVARDFSLSLDKDEIDFGDVEREEENIIAKDASDDPIELTASVESLDYEYSLSVTASALGDIPAANIVWSTDDGASWAATSPYVDSYKDKDYTFQFKIDAVPSDTTLGSKTGTITFDLSTVIP